jgi:polyferredoxin
VVVVRQGTVRVSVPLGTGSAGTDGDDGDDDEDDLLLDEQAGGGALSSPSSLSSRPRPLAASARAGPGAVLNLSAVLLNQPAPSDVRAERSAAAGDGANGGAGDDNADGSVVLWTAPAAAVRAMAASHPEAALELGLRLSQALSASLSEAEAELEAEQLRQRVLAPFRVAQPRAGVVGTSRYADNLRRSIVAAARDRTRRPVYFFGEPGLHKDDLAALVHFGSNDRARPLIRIDCARFAGGGGGGGDKRGSGAKGGGRNANSSSSTNLDENEDLTGGGLLLELFGRGSRGGLLYHLRDGALLLSNVHRLPSGVLPALAEFVRTGNYQPLPALAALAATGGTGGGGGQQQGPPMAAAGPVSLSSLDLLAPPARRSAARVILTASRQVPMLTAAVNGAMPRAAVAAVGEQQQQPQPKAAAAAAAPSTTTTPPKKAAKPPSAAPSPPPSRVITVPPLRVRRGDVLDVARYQLRVLERLSGCRLSLSREAEGRLEAYAWPDNQEEVEAVIGRAVQQATAAAGKAAAGGEGAATSGSSLATSRPSSPFSALLPSSQRQTQNQQRPAVVLEPELFWGVAEDRDRLRLNLLSTVPNLRTLLRSRFWPQLLHVDVVRPVFVAVVLLLFFGPQTRDANFALSFFWNGWWPIMFVAYLFVGRIWCSFCPFMTFGELAQGLRLKLAGAEDDPDSVLRRWPRAEFEKYGGWFMLILFGGILVWEEAWDLPNTAALSSWLLLLITAGAVAGSLVWEKRAWCRYACPIGAMNGMFAKLAMTELRSKQGVCSGSCSTYGCYKGQGRPSQWWSPTNRKPVPVVVAPEGLADPGCPVGSHPAQLTDNRACVLCGQCAKACPHRSVEFRFRPPAIDLWAAPGSRHTPLEFEASMLLMLLGAVYLHRLPQLTMQVLGGSGGGDREASALAAERLSALAWSSSPPASSAAAEPFFLAEPLRPLFEWWMAHRPEHVAVSVAVLFAPGLLILGVDGAQRVWSAAVQQQRQRAGAAASAAAAEGGSGAAALASPAAPVTTPLPPFLELSYSYMPLTWAATLAHYEEQMLLELGRLLPVTARTFGLGAAFGERLPAVQAHPAVVAFLQGATLLVGCGATLALSRRLAARPWVEIAPQCLVTLALTAELWWLMV